MKNPEKQENEAGSEEKIVLAKEEYQRLLDQAKEAEAMRDTLLRRAADYDNARKRLAKEREEFIKFSQEKLIHDLLPTLDNLERALAHVPDDISSHAVIAGIQLVWKQLLNLLSDHGLKRLSTEGVSFDPHLHEAVGQVEEKGPEGVIVKEVTAGYLLHDRVLRPAKVQIRVLPGAGPKASEEKEDELT